MTPSCPSLVSGGEREGGREGGVWKGARGEWAGQRRERRERGESLLDRGRCIEEKAGGEESLLDRGGGGGRGLRRVCLREVVEVGRGRREQ